MRSIVIALFVLWLEGLPTVHFSPIFPPYHPPQWHLPTVRFSHSTDKSQLTLQHVAKVYDTSDILYGGDFSHGESSAMTARLLTGSQNHGPNHVSSVREPSARKQLLLPARNSPSYIPSSVKNSPSSEDVRDFVYRGIRIKHLPSVGFHLQRGTAYHNGHQSLAEAEREDSIVPSQHVRWPKLRQHRKSENTESTHWVSQLHTATDADEYKPHDNGGFSKAYFPSGTMAVNDTNVVFPSDGKLHNIAVHRGKRTYPALFHTVVRLAHVTAPATDEFVSSSIDSERLKSRMQQLYKDVFPKETIGGYHTINNALNTNHRLNDLSAFPAPNKRISEGKITETDLGSEKKRYLRLAILWSIRSSLKKPYVVDDSQPDTLGSTQHDYLSQTGSHSQIKTEVGLPIGDSPYRHGIFHSRAAEKQPILITRRRGMEGCRNNGILSSAACRADLVRRLHVPSELLPLSSPRARQRERQEKEKKERLVLHELLHKAQPLRPPSTPTLATPRVCQQGDSLVPVMTCSSDVSVCLVDTMFCDGIKHCPLGEDEDPSQCVLRLWMFIWLNNIHSIFNAYIPPKSRGAQPRSHGYVVGRSYGGTRPS